MVSDKCYLVSGKWELDSWPKIQSLFVSFYSLDDFLGGFVTWLSLLTLLEGTADPNTQHFSIMRK